MEYDSISTECMKQKSEKPIPEKQKAISGSMVHSRESEEEKSYAGCTINKSEQKNATAELLKERDELRKRISNVSTAFI